LKWGKEWTPGHVSSFGVPSTCAQKEKKRKRKETHVALMEKT